MDLSQIGDLTALPWQLQLVFASGYCAYLIAYVGLRHRHKATDTVFASLSFGLVALIVLSAPIEIPFLPPSISSACQAALAFLLALAAGVLWRSVLRDRIRQLFRDTNYSWADDTLSAWDRMQENSRHGPTQLTVAMDDGSFLYCTDAGKVRHLPFGPFILGTAGDVLMYADQAEGPDGVVKDVEGVFTDDWGNLITYIPKEHIRSIKMRVTGPAAEAE